MKRLLCDQCFDEIIAEVAKMSDEGLTNHLNHFSDSEIKLKLELLGLANTKVEYEMKRFINQRQSFSFKRLAETFKHGKYRLKTYDELRNKMLI